MRIEHLEEFIYLMDSLNFTHTANHFFMNQSALSRHIAALEQELDTQLFVRDKGSVRPTAEAVHFAKDVKRTISSYYDALESLRAYKSGTEESLSVAYLLGVAGPFIPKIHKTFSKAHPEVNVSYFMYELQESARSLLDGRSDVLIGHIEDSPRFDKCSCRVLYTDYYYVAVPEWHRLASLEFATVEDLRGERIAVPSHSYWHENAQDLKEYLSPIEDDVDVVSLLQDMNSAPLVMATCDCVVITLGHLSLQYRDGFRFIKLVDCPLEFKAGIAWRAGEHGETIDEFVDVVSAIMEGPAPFKTPA